MVNPSMRRFLAATLALFGALALPWVPVPTTASYASVFPITYDSFRTFQVAVLPRGLFRRATLLEQDFERRKFSLRPKIPHLFLLLSALSIGEPQA